MERGVGRLEPERDEYEPYRVQMRKQHGYCGPYRLGIAVGRSGAVLPGPYAEGSRAAKNYADGVLYGRDSMLGSKSEIEYQSWIERLRTPNVK